MLGFNNTVFDQYRATQELNNAATLAGVNASKDYMDAGVALQGAVGDSISKVEEYRQTQLLANDAAMAAETAFLNAAAALGEMNEATLVRLELDLLKKELDAGRLSAEQYRDATEALLTQFGFLSDTERTAQAELDALRQAFADGHLTASNYALAVQAVKAQLDALESRDIKVSIRWDVPPLPIPNSAQVSMNPRQFMYAEGGYTRGGLAMVGERGPEMVQMPRGSQVYTAKETQTTNNYTFNLTGTYQTGPSQMDDVRTLAMLYGAR
jgi:hypothetical protein